MTWRLPNVAELPRSLTGRSDIDVSKMAETLTSTLDHLGASCELAGVNVGPQTISFALRSTGDTRVRDYYRLDRSKDLAYALASESVRIQAPIPGTQTIGVEIANPARSTVLLGDVVDGARAPLTAALGLDAYNRPVSLDIASLPHLLCAGASGSGKTTLVHAMLCSLLAVSDPDSLALMLIDPKATELTPYEGLPHLISDVLCDPQEAVDALWWLVESEMEARYRLLRSHGVRDLASYNALPGVDTLPYVLVCCDELADLMMRSAGEVESAVVRLGQKGRSAGIHMMLCTQSPHASVCTGMIKANMLGRIALKVVSATHSRVILGRGGAESLLGRGDLLLEDGSSGVLQRAQAPWVPPETVESIVRHWTGQSSREEIAA